ncbi:MAG: ATP-dependent RecD-like DNA helicase [Firmicutes bacterium]|nr:ATP-dependent RecD-like DNA helicase [Bacillota bacterium]
MQEVREVLISEIIFHNDTNAYTVAIAETREEQFTVVGALPDFCQGRTYALTGEWKIHPTYGEQFAFTEFREVMPTSKDGIEGFLASGVLKGIGKKTAAAIVSKFGEDALRIIEEEPDRLVEVSGIGPAKAAAVAEAFQAHREFAEVALYFQQYGISAEYAMKLYKQYGSATIAIATENPYSLVKDISGIGFKKADAMALKLGISKNDEYRIKSGVEYTLWYFAGEGHTFMPQKELCEKAAGLLDVMREEVEERLVDMVFEGDIRIDMLEGRAVVYLFPYYQAERNVAGKLAELNDAMLKPVASDVMSLISLTEREAGISLSENQRLAVVNSLYYGVSVITGGPGTGKTTIINAVINVLTNGGHKVAVCAPTGRAAKRITEVSGYFAQTVHRLLEYYYSEGDDAMKFGRNQENPLDYDAVIVDESSMVDLLLMNGLLNAIKPGTRLIMVGDSDQLQSVGTGNVLRDIIESEFVHVTKLTEIFRQAKESMIVVNSHRINKGEYPDSNEKDTDFFFMRRGSEPEVLSTVKELYKTRLPKYFSDLDPVRDIQILTPVRKGLLGSMNLNKELQDILNPAEAGKPERKYGEKVFRVGDKVMQIKNNYMLEWKRLSDFTDGEGVFNGDIGFVHSIDTEFNQMTVVFDEDKFATYDFSNLDELELAYAITVHKSQGSEFPIVVMPVSWFPPLLSTRNLLYTAVTRGKKAVVLVGSERRMEAMIDNNTVSLRYSGLAERLRLVAKGME